MNRIIERTSEQFAWRSSKLETTGDDSSTKADNKKIEEIASPPSADRK